MAYAPSDAPAPARFSAPRIPRRAGALDLWRRVRVERLERVGAGWEAPARELVRPIYYVSCCTGWSAEPSSRLQLSWCGEVTIRSSILWRVTIRRLSGRRDVMI